MPDNFCNCPVCKSYAIRVRRRFVDRVKGLINPTYRYRCLNYHCQWQGNICRRAEPQGTILPHKRHA